MTQQDYIYSSKMCLLIFGFKENTGQKNYYGQKARSYLNHVDFWVLENKSSIQNITSVVRALHLHHLFVTKLTEAD